MKLEVAVFSGELFCNLMFFNVSVHAGEHLVFLGRVFAGLGLFLDLL